MPVVRYDEDRRAFGNAIVAHSRFLGSYIEPEEGKDQPPRETIIRQYGASSLLREADPSVFGGV